MNAKTTNRLLHWLKNAVSAGPWILSMYVLYYAEKHQLWIPETPHRDKITIVVLVLGLALSFLLKSYFNGKKNK
ncbi:MAG: hypothetical protein QMC30_09205 [Porticoccaceae bacterium]|jgi:hypothetical protein